MDPDEALKQLGNPSKMEFFRKLRDKKYRGDLREVANGLVAWLRNGGFPPKLWTEKKPYSPNT